MFIKLSRYNADEQVLINLATVRTIHPQCVDGDADRTVSCITFSRPEGEGGHTVLVNEDLQTIIDKIDAALAVPAEDLAERNARYKAATAVRKVRRKVEYLVGSNRENRAI